MDSRPGSTIIPAVPGMATSHRPLPATRRLEQRKRASTCPWSDASGSRGRGGRSGRPRRRLSPSAPAAPALNSADTRMWSMVEYWPSCTLEKPTWRRRSWRRCSWQASYRRSPLGAPMPSTMPVVTASATSLKSPSTTRGRRLRAAHFGQQHAQGGRFGAAPDQRAQRGQRVQLRVVAGVAGAVVGAARLQVHHHHVDDQAGRDFDHRMQRRAGEAFGSRLPGGIAIPGGK
jgi:hypothetical protein